LAENKIIVMERDNQIAIWYCLILRYVLFSVMLTQRRPNLTTAAVWTHSSATRRLLPVTKPIPRQTKAIDSVSYHENWHQPVLLTLTDPRGGIFTATTVDFRQITW